MIKNLVFDFGGVMTTCATPMRVKEIVDRAGLPWQAVLDAFHTHRRDYDLGAVTVHEFYARTWREAGVTVEADLERAIEQADTSSYLYRNERTLAWMRSLKERGFRIAILTNMPRELVPHFKEKFADFIALAEVTVISSEEHLIKPMREIYDLVLARMAGARADETCFFDDTPANCEGARNAHWQAIRFVSNEQAERDLECKICNIPPHTTAKI